MITEKQKTLLCAIGLARFILQNLDTFETREQLFAQVKEKVEKMKEGAKIGRGLDKMFADDPTLQSLYDLCG